MMKQVFQSLKTWCSIYGKKLNNLLLAWVLHCLLGIFPLWWCHNDSRDGRMNSQFHGWYLSLFQWTRNCQRAIVIVNNFNGSSSRVRLHGPCAHVYPIQYAQMNCLLKCIHNHVWEALIPWYKESLLWWFKPKESYDSLVNSEVWLAINWPQRISGRH